MNRKLVFVVLLFLTSDESNVTVSEEIGPEFQKKQLFGLLKQDSKKAYQRKCTSGNERAFDEFMNGKTELKNCSKMWWNPDDKTIQKWTDFKSAAMSYCQRRDGLFDCLNDFIALKERCSFPSEIERANQLRNLFKAIVDSICSNGGTDLVSLVSRDGEGRKCVKTNKNEIMTCVNKGIYAVGRRILTKYIENEHFEFKMDKEDCNEFDAVMECFVSSVENCADPTATNQITSMFAIFRDQTSCSTTTQLLSNTN